MASEVMEGYAFAGEIAEDQGVFSDMELVAAVVVVTVLGRDIQVADPRGPRSTGEGRSVSEEEIVEVVVEQALVIEDLGRLFLDCVQVWKRSKLAYSVYKCRSYLSSHFVSFSTTA